MILQANHIHKTYGGTVILDDVHIQVNDQERVGLIGPNGAGKSTLLKIITGEIPADQGEIQLAKKAQIGFLAQDSGLDSSLTIWDELLSVFSGLRELENQLRELEREMGKEEVYTNEKRYQKTLEKYASLQEKFEENGGYAFEARIRGALHGLGLGEIDWKNTLVSSLSGGQKTRVALAKMLLAEPDLLILDEPTNYLDMSAVAWLEQTLLNYSGSILVVSHDRYFLDRLVTVIYELEHTRVTRYPGNYSAYVKQKEENLARELKMYEKQQAEIKRMEEFVQRNIARASTTKRAQSRRKALEKMERIDKPNLGKRQAAIRFETAVTSGREVLTATNLSVGYDEPILHNLHFHIDRGEHIALLGPNGVGKSTLLKTIAGKLPALSGELKWGVQVVMDYYDQEQKDLDPQKQVIDEVWDDHPHLDQTTIRSYLGQFLFSGEDVFKQVHDLSGGEKARLSLCKRMLNQANFLLMDEPTNHLDLVSKERLEQALEGFPGTLLFVSHDRYFIRRLATRIWEVTPEGIKDYRGNYEWYLEKKALERLETEQAEKKDTTFAHKHAEAYRRKEKEEQRQRKKRELKVKELEEAIAQIEAEISHIHEQLCQPELFNDPVKSASLQKELAAQEELLAQKTEEWLEWAES
ncbi:MAG: ABC-F family ATP-binding cassette domain-containing protein [Thermoactinomyces sp.]